MKYISAFLSICLLCGVLLRLDVSAVDVDDIMSETAVLMDAATGQILFAKDMDRVMYPASTTKIMTALLAAEYADPGETTVVTASALAIDEPDSANVDLMEGEVLYIRDVLYGMMLRSANEAANVLAEHVAGSPEAFADLMNQKALEIGATSTHFTNPHGLHDPDHYTTARDLATITRYAMQNSDFATYFGTDYYTMPATNMHEDRTISNHQYMLFDISPYYNEYVVGGKTGFTNEARNTLSTVAVKDGRMLICVVMSSSAYEKFTDTQKLLDYGFESFTPYTVSSDRFSSFLIPIHTDGQPAGDATLAYNSDVTLLLPEGADPNSLSIGYEYPTWFDGEDSVEAYLSLSLSNAPSTFPGTLLRLPMETDVLMEAMPVSLALEEESRFSLNALLEKIFSGSLIILCVVVIGIFWILLFMVFLRHRRLQKRRRDRHARLMDRTRMQHASTSDPLHQAPTRSNSRTSYSYSSRASGSRRASYSHSPARRRQRS